MWCPVALPGASRHSVTRTSGVSTWTSDFALIMVTFSRRLSRHEHHENVDGEYHQMHQSEQDVGAAGAESEHAENEGHGQEHRLLLAKPQRQLLVQRISGHGHS